MQWDAGAHARGQQGHLARFTSSSQPTQDLPRCPSPQHSFSAGAAAGRGKPRAAGCGYSSSCRLPLPLRHWLTQAQQDLDSIDQRPLGKRLHQATIGNARRSMAVQQRPNVGQQRLAAGCQLPAAHRGVAGERRGEEGLCKKGARRGLADGSQRVGCHCLAGCHCRQRQRPTHALTHSGACRHSSTVSHLLAIDHC